jgi:4-hydroxy-tetrahydrodipicolinate synthase
VNPIPIKTAMAMTGRCQESFRLPLVRMAPDRRERLAEVLGAFGLR